MCSPICLFIQQTDAYHVGAEVGVGKDAFPQDGGGRGAGVDSGYEDSMTHCYIEVRSSFWARSEWELFFTVGMSELNGGEYI